MRWTVVRIFTFHWFLSWGGQTEYLLSCTCSFLIISILLKFGKTLWFCNNVFFFIYIRITFLIFAYNCTYSKWVYNSMTFTLHIIYVSCLCQNVINQKWWLSMPNNKEYGKVLMCLYFAWYYGPWLFINMSHNLKKPVLCHMQTPKVQISLHIHAVWSVPMLLLAA